MSAMDIDTQNSPLSADPADRATEPTAEHPDRPLVGDDPEMQELIDADPADAPDLADAIADAMADLLEQDRQGGDGHDAVAEAPESVDR